MLEKLFGIARRAYYFSAFSIFIGCILGYFFADWCQGFDPDLYLQGMKSCKWYDPARDNVLMVGVIILPLAFTVHKIFHWIVFGKLK